MLRRLSYLAVTSVFTVVRLLPVSGTDKDIEILALRHQLAILQRRIDRPQLTGADRAFLAALLHRLVATVVQMVFGELFPKNLAIARPEPVARRLALSTTVYLKVFSWLIRIFDAASNLLVRAMRIEPVHDVEHAATSRDLEAIIDESRDSGDLPPHLSVLLDRVLDSGTAARGRR